MNSRWLTIKQLDKQLKEWQAVNKKYGMPRTGWVKTLRLALSMSAEQLGSRLGFETHGQSLTWSVCGGRSGDVVSGACVVAGATRAAVREKGCRR